MARGSRRAQELHDLRNAAGLDQVLEHGAVLARELLGPLGRGIGLVDGIGLDPERAPDVGLAAAQPGAVLAPDGERLGAGRELRGVAQAGDGADAAELAVDARDQQDQPAALAGGLDRATLAVAFDGQGHGHVWKDDDVVHGEDWEKLGSGGVCHVFRKTFTRPGAFPIRPAMALA